jgi:hypothetical protein
VIHLQTKLVGEDEPHLMNSMGVDIVTCLNAVTPWKAELIILISKQFVNLRFQHHAQALCHPDRIKVRYHPRIEIKPQMRSIRVTTRTHFNMMKIITEAIDTT